jgi:hypothetical protein
MTESKIRAEVRALVRRATADIVKQAMISGEYRELVIARAPLVLDAGSLNVRASIADEIAAEVATLADRLTPKKVSSRDVTAREVAP